MAIRQPIVTVVGHVDHGKTSVLDFFRESAIQSAEAGGITQKISYTKFPITQIKNACPLIDSSGVEIAIPGFLFIDTPGHAAFTNLRKRGGSLADLAILVVSIKDGIMPQTAEVLQILKKYKTPFMIALNKIDQISGWKNHPGDLKKSVESQAIHISQEFQEALLTFQGALSEHGFESDLFYEVDDFSKKIAIVPCSAKTGEGIPELLFTLCGLCQGYLKERLEVSDVGKGVVLEIKKERSMDYIESILYDGNLKIGDEIAIASFDEPIVSKIRAIEEVEPLCFDYKSVKKINAATGARIHLKNKLGILPGMPFQVIKGNLDDLKKEFKHELSEAMTLDKSGIIVKADSLGSLDALQALLRAGGVKIVKAGIGSINKGDVISAKANLDINPLDSLIIGFNVETENDIDVFGIKVLKGEVVYKLIDDLQEWRKQRQDEIERERLLGLATICKLEILPQYVFRNSNPAIFGVRVLGGSLKIGLNLIDEQGEKVARVKGLQKEKETVSGASEGDELALSLPGVNFERRLGDKKYLYVDIGVKQFKEFKKNKDLLSSTELKVLDELVRIKGVL
jgi:translation initiation factor 5B